MNLPQPKPWFLGGAQIYVRHLWPVGLASALPGGLKALKIPVPADPVLEGVTVCAQGFLYPTTTPPLRLDVSAALYLTPGR